MDTGKGKFEMLLEENQEKLAAAKAAMEEKHPEHGGWFRIGEIIEIRGSKFRVKAVKPTQLILKLLPKSSSHNT
jgi:hypothetical protein